jgi:UDP-N-acetylmuramoyl-tripeptide--D-alanyl-D-alanine ligase
LDQGAHGATTLAPSAPFWTLDHVADALRDCATVEPPRGAGALRAVATDTRTVGKGDLFVALIGDRFDAHDFLADAVAKGAAAVVVSDAARAASLGVPVYVVRDTLVALGALARHRRRWWGKRIVAVAGSNGKTSTKELLKAALGSRLRVHASSGNFNNRVGVPLTLLALPDDAEIAVVEMGTNEPGEIAILRAIGEPDLAVVTSIGEEHLEGLGDLAGVLREESAIFDGTPVVVTPASLPEVAAAARGRAGRVIEAGLDAGDVRATRWGIDSEGLGWIEIGGTTVRPPVRGAHNLRNAMLAVAAAAECGVPPADAGRGLAAMPQPKMRLAAEPLGSALLINDAYNANPGSTRAAVDLLDGTARGRQRVLVLGTMRELGAGAAALHAEIAKRAVESSIEVIAGIGDFAPALDAVRDERVVTAPDVDELWPLLRERIAPDAVILLKASRGMKLERIVPHLTTWAAATR